MDANLRIIKSIKKIKEELTTSKDEQELLLDKTKKLESADNNFKKEIEQLSKKQEDYLEEQNKIENRLKEKIEKIELTPGPQGIPGKDGKDGRDGKDGERGLPGKDGRDGKDGIDGIGIPGINGKDGKDGIGISSAKVNNDGDLIIKLTNDKTINVGHVKGQNGAGINGINGRDGNDGIGVSNAEIKNNHLIITLTNGDEIDAGYVGGGSGGVSSYNDLTDKPLINNVEISGNISSDDLGIINDKNYIHSQTVASDTWVIEHNMNKYPAVTVINSANEEVIGEITYNNVNQLTVSFIGAFKGKAILN